MNEKIVEFKKLAAEKSLDYIKDGMIVGLGSGSTVYWMLLKLSVLVKKGLKIKGVPTSFKTMNLAKKMGIPLTNISTIEGIDIAIDGADEIDKDLNLIKGGGGSLVREKIVALFASKLIIIGDDTKKVDNIGNNNIPIEVTPFGWEIVANHYIPKLGGKAKLRKVSEEIFISDNKNFIIDCQFENILDLRKLESELKTIVGVVDTGIFINLADEVILSGEKGIQLLQ